MRQIRAPLGGSPGEGEDLYGLLSRLRELMWEHVGLIRTGAGLKSAIAEIEEISRRAERCRVPAGPAYNLAWQDWLNLNSQTATARLIARSALERAESRGSHFRADFPQSSAELYTVYVAVADAPTPNVWTEPVRLTRLAPSAARGPQTVEVGD